MSQPRPRGGGGWEWDSEDPRIKAELDQWWSDHQRPDRAENRPCMDTKWREQSSQSPVRNAKESVRVCTDGSCLPATS